MKKRLSENLLAKGLAVLTVVSSVAIAQITTPANVSGTVVGWGPLVISGENPPFSSIASGGSHSLALKQDETVVAWGNNLSGLCDVPSDLGGVVAIAASVHQNLALKQDGTVVAWGGDYWGNYYGQCNVPSGLNDVVAIAATCGAGGYASAAVRAGLSFNSRPQVPRQHRPPDGTQVVFDEWADDASHVSVFDTNTGQVRRLGAGESPVWSPDGSRIAFRLSDDSIHTIRADGSERLTLAELPRHLRGGHAPVGIGYGNLVWSPDSTQLLYSLNGFSGGVMPNMHWDVYRVGFSGGAPVNLTDDLGSARPVAWLTSSTDDSRSVHAIQTGAKTQ